VPQQPTERDLGACDRGIAAQRNVAVPPHRCNGRRFPVPRMVTHAAVVSLRSVGLHSRTSAAAGLAAMHVLGDVALEVRACPTNWSPIWTGIR